ncbi:hypothetical protein EDB84DRAFT_1440106 [Lactarius hengduanensis]|nr:hypothetical protein EDB84DRAFT_1440106 [Lactarius hengduanensis]
MRSSRVGTGMREAGVERGEGEEIAACLRFALTNVFGLASGVENEAGATGRELPESKLLRGNVAWLGCLECAVLTVAEVFNLALKLARKGADKTNAGVISSGEETESTVLSPGGRCGSVEWAEMGAFDGASGDARRKGMGSPCDDSDLENSGDSELSGATSTADTGVDLNSQGLGRDSDRDDLNDRSGDRATGSESSVEISS